MFDLSAAPPIFQVIAGLSIEFGDYGGAESRANPSLRATGPTRAKLIAQSVEMATP